MTTTGKLHSWSYSGTAWTDADGRAVVSLQAEALLHRDGFQHDVIADSGGTARIEAPVATDGRVVIATGIPHRRLTWHLTPYHSTAVTKKGGT